MNNTAHYQKYRKSILKNKRKYYREKRDIILAKQYKKYWEDPLHDHGKKIKKRYGVSKDDYQKLLKKQRYKCAICRIKYTEFKRRLGVDHCHKTGKVRGLLCDKCNSMLGHANDTVKLLKKGIEYLENE